MNSKVQSRPYPFSLPFCIRVESAAWVLVLLIAALSVSPCNAQPEPVRRVLILYEVDPTYPAVDLIDRGIREALEKSPQKVDIYREYMDTILFPDAPTQKQIRDFYIQKYGARKPDVIVTVGSSPLQFMLESHASAFPGIPVVFCLPNGVVPPVSAEDSYITGIENDFAPGKTVEAALKLKPLTKHIFVVGGVSPFDRQEQAAVRQQLKPYEGRLDISYLTDLPMPEILARLRNLPEHSIVLLTTMGQDAAGARFKSNETGPLVVEAANAPVFSLADVYLNHGEVGGFVLGIREEGNIAGAVVLRILAGEKPQNIPEAKGIDTPIFDWMALKRWGMNEKNLPPGSVVINRQPGFLELYWRYILAGLFVLLVQSLVILGLLWQRAQRRRVQAELVRSNERLRVAMESGNSVGWEWDMQTGRDSWFGDLPTVFGISSNSFNGQVGDFYRYVHPDDRERVSETVADARKSGNSYAAEFRVVRKDGSTRWIVSRGIFEYAQNGDARRMLGMAVDITERKKVEEALRTSEEKFSKAFRQSPLAVALINARDHRYIDVNETFEEMTGWRRDEVLGRTPMDLGIWVDPLHRGKIAEELLAGKQVRNINFMFRTKDGKVRAALGSSELIRIDGELSTLSVVADVTERLRAQEALRQSEQRSRDLVLRSPVAMVVTRGATRNSEMVNLKFTEMFGYTIEDVPDEAHWWPLAYPDERYRESVKAEWEARICDAMRHHVEIEPMDALVRCKNGTSRYIEFHFASLGDTALVSFVDLTERQMAEDSLRESEERFRLVANAAPVMIWMSDSDKSYTYFNQSWLKFTGRSIHQELGEGWIEGVHPYDQPRCLSTYSQAFDRREIFAMEYRLRRCDGEYRWVFDQGVPRLNADGSFSGYIGSCIDVTERKQAQQALSDINRKLIEAHEQERAWIARELHDDINQRLALVSVNMESLLQDSGILSAAVAQRVEDIRGQLSGLGSDIQSLSHHLHSSKLEYLGIVAAAASFCREMSEKHKVQIEFHADGVPKGLPQEIALCLFRVLQEAVLNGVKHSGSKHFEVWLNAGPDGVELRVRDSGVGFNPEVAAKGYGLGLTSMRERLKLVHGELTIDSQFARGTEIRAIVPLHLGTKTARA